MTTLDAQRGEVTSAVRPALGSWRVSKTGRRTRTRTRTRSTSDSRNAGTRSPTRSSIPLFRPSPRPLGILLLLLAGSSHLLPGAHAFYFQWSSTSYQCYTQTLSWVGGKPPFRAVLAPILQMPFVYDIPDSAYVNGKGAYDITVQLTSGLSYIMMMGDATGMGTGGSSGRITVQGYAESTCLGSATVNQTTLDLSFEVFQTNIQQCQKSFNMSWDLTQNAVPPYNMTVISLDQSFNPFDVAFGNMSNYEWQVNVPAGKGFTLMMNDGKGYGYGGVANAYSVNRTGGNSECDVVGGGSGGTTTTTTRRSSTTTAVPPTDTEAGSGDGNGPPKGTVIAGASIGALVGIGLSAAVAFFIFVYRRRRRRNRPSRSQGKNEPPGGVIMVDGRRRPDDAMSVNLFDDSEGYHDPNDGNYAPVPYDVGGTSSYSGSPITPASAAGLGIGGRPGQNRYVAARAGEDSPLSTGNPFEGRELMGEEAAAALALAGGRSWSGTSSATDLPYTQGQGHTHDPTRGGLPLDTFSDSRTSAAGWEQTRPSGTSRTKSEEAVADSEAVGASTRPDRLASYPSTELPSPLSAPLSSAGGGFRITNATDADPLLPPPLPSQTQSSSPGPGRRQRGEPRFVRHADAGRATEEVIDLPPLYTDLVHESGGTRDSR